MTDSQLSIKYVEWFKTTYEAIQNAGGNPTLVIDKFPVELIDTMVRNGLYIEFRKI